MSKHALARRGLIGTLAAGLVATPLALGFAASAQAAPSTTVVINEVYGGGGNTGAPLKTDFVELYNPTGAPVDVTGWSVQYRSANGTSPNVTTLTGTVPAGGYFLVSQASGTGAQPALPAADATGDAAMSGSTGVVLLASNATPVTAQGNFALDGVRPANVVDTVGYGATATTFETSPTAGTANATSASRTQADNDNNATEFTVGAPTPRNSGRVGVTNPGAKTASVNEAITPFTVGATGGTVPYSFTSSTLPPGLTIGSANGTVSGTPTTAGRYSVTVTVTDSAATPASSSTTFDYRVLRAPVSRTIAEVQGTGPATTVEDIQQVTVQGRVTAAYPTGGLDGFFLQTGGSGGATDATPGASDGIFIASPANAVPALGASVEVTGTVVENFGRTQITSSSIATVAALPAVTAASLPWSELDTDTEKESHEGELVAPVGPFTVTNSFTINTFGEVGLASGTTPLIQPTEIRDFQTGNPSEITIDNDRRKVVLDDGSSNNLLTGDRNVNIPWLAPDKPVRVGAPVTFTGPVALDFGFGLWRFQPTAPVTDTGATTATFANTRTAAPEAVPGQVRIATFNVLNYFPTTGEEYVTSGRGTCEYNRDRAGVAVTNASCTNNGPRGAATTASLARQQAKIVDAINKLGASVVSLEELENSVQFGKDRDFAIGVLVNALNSASAPGTWAFAPSPAAADLPTPAQEDVIRTGFIYKPADVQLVGPSVVLKDEVNFDNAREPLAQAFRAVGTEASKTFGVVVNHFKSKGCASPALPANDPNSDQGQGCFTADRIGQAQALKAFATSFADQRGIKAVFLAGDFNSYTMEDPLQVLTGGGYTAIESDTPGEETYSFSGLSGSLDHVLANPAALGLVSGADVWNINSPESIAYQYSRYNYNANSIPLYNADPFSSSDHDPEIVGLDFAGTTARVAAADQTAGEGKDTTVRVTVSGPGATPTGSVGVFNDGVRLGTAPLVNGAADVLLDTSGLKKGTYRLSIAYGGDAVYDSASGQFTLTVVEPASRDIQILATNDFHGRLLNNAPGAPGQPASNTAGGPEAGAAILSGAVKKLRQDNPDTVFAAAGDLIGASTFESFIQNDEPTIDALNEAGLEVSAAGNHEFDQGYEDLVGRVQDRADWEYIAANVQEPTGRDELAESWTKDFGNVKVGFVGAVTEDLPTLVNPAGIAGVTVTDIVAATNAEANALEAAGADLIVLLVHEGAPGTDCATMDDDPTSAFGSIITGVNANVDAIVSGHTHLAYNCSFPVAEWSGRAVTERPVVSAGQYGSNLNQLAFTVDTTTGVVQAKKQAVLALKANGTTANYPADPAVLPIVQDAIDKAAVLGARVLGQVAAPFQRAKLANGTTENRGGESTLGNLVAEVQRWATRNPESGAAQVAFMNPGGLRTDLVGNVNGAARDVTFRQAAEVQPFANTLVNMDLTGAQIETALEQQWQPAGSSRPFLKLGISQGFTYTYVPPAAGAPSGTKGEVTAMYLDGELIEDTDVLSVTVNSFLASGGDAFAAFASGAGKQDTGKTDLQAQVDYFAEFANAAAGDVPLPVDYSQRGVGVTFPASAPATYAAGDTVAFDLSSLAMTGPADVVDPTVEVILNGASLGSFPVTTVLQAALPGFDESGTASVSVTLPASLAPGAQVLVVKGPRTGTEVRVPITIDGETPAEPVDTTIEATAAPASVVVGTGRTTITATVDPASGDADATGVVEVRDGTTVLGTGTLAGGRVEIRLPRSTTVGARTLTVAYLGSDGFAPSTDTVVVRVTKQTPAMVVKAPGTVKAGVRPVVSVTIAARGVDVTGKVQFRYLGKVVVRTVHDGVASVKLPRLTKKTVVSVRYLGSDTLTAVARQRTIKAAK